MTQTQKDKATKKVEIAIDKIIDLQDMGIEGNECERVLDALRSLETRIWSRD